MQAGAPTISADSALDRLNSVPTRRGGPKPRLGRRHGVSGYLHTHRVHSGTDVELSNSDKVL